MVAMGRCLPQTVTVIKRALGTAARSVEEHGISAFTKLVRILALFACFVL